MAGQTFTISSNVTLYAQWIPSGGTSGGTAGGISGGVNSSSVKYSLHYESNGGTKYPDETYAKGASVKLDKTPVRAGYIFTGWYVENTLTHKMTQLTMNENKTVYAGWKANEQNELHIPDMLNGESHMAYIAGYPDGTVGPNNQITRGEVAMIFYRLLKDDVRDANETTINTFTDVTDNMWCNKAISTIARLGIVAGRSSNTFDPNAPITRGEFAAICARFDKSHISPSLTFSDTTGHWAEGSIERAAALGWVHGYTDRTFRPNNTITRAEAMCMINRVLGRLPENESDLLPGMKTWPDISKDAWYYLHVQEATNSHTYERKADGIHESWTGLLNKDLH